MTIERIETPKQLATRVGVSEYRIKKLIERLARYEVHLDRKLERSFAMLFRLKELRPCSGRKSVWQNQRLKKGLGARLGGRFE